MEYKLTLEEVKECEAIIDFAAMFADDPNVSKGFRAAKKLLNHYKYIIKNCECVSCPEEELVYGE